MTTYRLRGYCRHDTNGDEPCEDELQPVGVESDGVARNLKEAIKDPCEQETRTPEDEGSKSDENCVQDYDACAEREKERDNGKQR